MHTSVASHRLRLEISDRILCNQYGYAKTLVLDVHMERGHTRIYFNEHGAERSHGNDTQHTLSGGWDREWYTYLMEGKGMVVLLGFQDHQTAENCCRIKEKRHLILKPQPMKYIILAVVISVKKALITY